MQTTGQTERGAGVKNFSRAVLQGRVAAGEPGFWLTGTGGLREDPRRLLGLPLRVSRNGLWRKALDPEEGRALAETGRQHPAGVVTAGLLCRPQRGRLERREPVAALKHVHKCPPWRGAAPAPSGTAGLGERRDRSTKDTSFLLALPRVALSRMRRCPGTLGRSSGGPTKQGTEASRPLPSSEPRGPAFRGHSPGRHPRQPLEGPRARPTQPAGATETAR